MGRDPAAPTVRAQAVVFRDGRLLSVAHRKRGATYWVLPGGHVEPGETVWEALARELGEESGVRARAGRLWAVGEFLDPPRHVLDCAFAVTDWEGEAALGADPEGAAREATLVDVAWLDREAVEAGPFRPGILRRRLLERWGDPSAPAVYLGVERA